MLEPSWYCWIARLGDELMFVKYGHDRKSSAVSYVSSWYIMIFIEIAIALWIWWYIYLVWIALECCFTCLRPPLGQCQALAPLLTAFQRWCPNLRFFWDLETIWLIRPKNVHDLNSNLVLLTWGCCFCCFGSQPQQCLQKQICSFFPKRDTTNLLNLW